MIINDLMCESRTRFIILHLAPVLLAGVLVTIYTSPLTALDVVYPKGILHVIVPFILVLTQALKAYSCSQLNSQKFSLYQLFCAFNNTNRQNVNLAELGIDGRSLRISSGRHVTGVLHTKLVQAYVLNLMRVHFIGEKVTQVFLTPLTRKDIQFSRALKES